MKYIKLFEDFTKSIEESKVTEAARVPSNILDFAKRKGSYATSLVKKAATWAEKAGKYISGGTAIGKDYMTIILDMKHQGSEIYINLNNETIELFGEEVTDAKSFKKVLDANMSESKVTEGKKTQTLEVVYQGPIKKYQGGLYKARKEDNGTYTVFLDEPGRQIVEVPAGDVRLVESVVNESHFKVGDKVKMSHGGTGVIVSLDKEDGAEGEKYYTVKTDDGEEMKHAPNELEKINEAKIQKFIESLSASKEAKNILHNLDVFAQLNPDYSPVEAIAYIEEGLKTSGNAIKKAKKISDLLYTAGILASDIEVFGRDVLSIITDGIAGKLAN